MEWLIAAGIAATVALVVAAAVVAQRRGWVDFSIRGFRQRQGGGGPPMNGFDEVFSPNRYEIQLQQDAQRVLPAPAPLPGDGERPDLESGRIRLRLVEPGAGAERPGVSAS
ncbi:MAG: hypothetical protein J0G30_02625 [Actinomycetales bacterium]|nr:hypothetical protein [Actinomycetales bacterium]